MDYKKWFRYLPYFKAFKCSYCGGVADTSDHTPPKCLLPKPLPKDIQLMTIPACTDCNSSFSRDERLFAGIVCTVSFNPSDISATSSNGWLGKTKKRDGKLREFIDSRMTDDGYFLLDQNSFDIIARIASKTTVGLLLYEFGRVVPLADVFVIGMDHAKNYNPTALAESYRHSDGVWAEVTPSGRELERQVQAMFGIPSRHTTKWKAHVPDYFEYLFIKRTNGALLTALKFHNAITVILECPWPSGAGPNRSKRNKKPNLRSEFQPLLRP